MYSYIYVVSLPQEWDNPQFSSGMGWEKKGTEVP